MYFLTTANIETAISLVASETAVGFDIENVLDPLGTSRWRSTGLAPFIEGEFESAQTINRWGNFYTNAGVGDTARLRLADTNAELTSAPVVDETELIVPIGADLSSFDAVHHVSVVTVPASALHFRVDYDFSTLPNPDGFVEIGGLALDTRFEPELDDNFNRQRLHRVAAMHETKLSAGGTSRGGGVVKRDLKLTLPNMTTEETLQKLSPILMGRRRVLPVVVVLEDGDDVTPMDQIYWGFLDADKVDYNEIRNSAEIPILEP